MGVDVNGIAHIQLTVNDPARSLPFWKKLCLFLGMQPLVSEALENALAGGHVALAASPRWAQNRARRMTAE